MNWTTFFDMVITLFFGFFAVILSLMVIASLIVAKYIASAVLLLPCIVLWWFVLWFNGVKLFRK